MLTRQQAWALIALTLMWGLNWPIMKLSLQELTPLYFRSSTMMLGAMWLFVYFHRKGLRMWPRGNEWWIIVGLGIPNILGWHTMSVMGVSLLPSGRSAILGFTMPIYTVLFGALLFKQPLTKRAGLAVACVLATIGLLTWHELTNISGSPAGILWMEGAALSWALGTLLMRRVPFELRPEVLTVWMMLLSSLVIRALAIQLEPVTSIATFSGQMWLTLVYAVVFNYGYAQVIWFGMARDLPPATSAMSIMAVPVIGTITATFIVGEVPHWQDLLAMVFGVTAIAAVLMPPKKTTTI